MTSYPLQFESTRTIHARWIVTSVVQFQTACQVGSQAADNCDQTFERNEQGFPVLHGSALAGALRSALGDRLGSHRSREDHAVRNLFGDLESTESRIIVFDSVVEGQGLSSIRDGVAICHTTGLAKDKFKYDRELLLPGLEFTLRFELIVPDASSEPDLLSQLAASLSSLETGDLAIGAGKSRGLGRLRACNRWKAQRFDLASVDGWYAYADSNPDDPLSKIPESETLQLPWGLKGRAYQFLRSWIIVAMLISR